MDSKNSVLPDKALQDALSPLVNNIIEENYESTKEQRSAHLAPLIGSAIREQIKSQKDDVVDALYPVIGNMISKYVSKSLEEMLSNINSQIQNGLSSKSIKRKIKARLKGVSETELLLSENSNSHIRAVFLIHKDTGIVLAQAQNPNYALHEPDMMASMMTAIRSFVNDCIAQEGETQELGEIEYGGNKIILEASSHSYLAIMVEGATYQITYEKIRDVFGAIITKHGENIRKFEGDLEEFSQLRVDDELALLLVNDAPEEENKKQAIHPLMYIVPLLLISWGAYSYYNSYQNETLTRTANEKLYKTSNLTTFRLSVDIKDAVATLRGEVPFDYHKRLAAQVIQKIEGIKKIENEIIVLPTLNDPSQISSNIAYYLKGFNAQKGVSLHYDYNYEKLILLGYTANILQKEQVLKVLKAIKGIKTVEDRTLVVLPVLNETIYFERGFTSLSKHEKLKLTKVIEQLHKSGANRSLILNAYTDLIGLSTKNNILPQKRMKSIVKFLHKNGNISNTIVTNDTKQAPKGVNPKKEPNKTRCVTISYIKEKK